MAWTLHLLVGISVMTASAYKCSFSSYVNSDVASQEPISIPDTRSLEHMSTRSAEILTSGYPSNVPDDVERAQFRIEDRNQHAQISSRVLSGQPYVETRHGQNPDKIVFPGPSSVLRQSSDAVASLIPESCRKIGICEDVLDYPIEQARKLIAENKGTGIFQMDELDTEAQQEPEIAQRVGPLDQNIELCNVTLKTVYPKAAVDAKGNWHLVLNQDNDPVQGFKVEICNEEKSPDGKPPSCAAIVSFQPGYSGRCKQKFVYRNMAVLHEGKKIERSLKVPSCCSCVVSQN